MTVKKFANFMLRIYDQYVEISKSSHGDVTDVDMFEIWDYLEEPEQESDGTTPFKDDFQVLLGLGIEF